MNTSEEGEEEHAWDKIIIFLRQTHNKLTFKKNDA